MSVSRVVRPCLLVVVTLATFVFVMPASAEVQVTRDSTEDVAKFPSGCDVLAEDCAASDPSNKDADITRFRTDFRPHSLMLRTSLRKLPAKGKGTVHVTWDIKFRGGYKVAGLAVRGGRLAMDEVMGSGCILSNARVGLVPRKRLVWMRIPAKCLDNSRWVRTAAGSHFTRQSGGPWWRDDARAPVELTYETSYKPTFGPRTHRG